MRRRPPVGGPLGVDAGPLEVLTSPAGLQQRLAAVELLERVRADVDRAGNEAAETLRNAMACAPEPTSAWQHAWNFLLAPPWELNQERRDWAAGAAVGILDTVVLATNPLPVALWVGATSKPQVNEFEQRFGVDPRSGFHTAGAVVVPDRSHGRCGARGPPGSASRSTSWSRRPRRASTCSGACAPLPTGSLRSATQLRLWAFAPTPICPLSTASWNPTPAACR